MKLIKGQKIIITYKDYCFPDTGKVATFVSMSTNSLYYFYVEGSDNNRHRIQDKDGNFVTWSLHKQDFRIIEQIQLLFPFMEEG